jgi:Cu(I)/Ag(I) efflux system membrane fusion protein
MKTKPLIILISSITIALIIGASVGRYILPNNKETLNEAHTHPDSASESSKIWTCSMHPQIQQPDQGDCPICGMDLIPVSQNSGDEQPREMSMSKSAMALADIQTSTIEKRYPEARIRLVGKLEYDETRVKSLTARFPARIDKLYVNYKGIEVKPGEHLGLIYSPDLLTAQRELLTAYRNAPDSAITRVARQKLELWDLLPDQIDAILRSGAAQDNFELRAPVGGVVTSLNVREGDYIETGQQLFKIVDLSHLWLKLDAYESDLGWLRYGQTVEFTVEAYPGEFFEGTISFIEPELDPVTRTVRIRVNVDNPDVRLKPGMFAKGIVTSQLAEGGKVFAPELSGKWISPMHPEIVKDQPGSCDVCGMDLVPAEELGFASASTTEAPLVVPSSAVLQTGKRAVVYIEKPDAESPTYIGREITLGPRAGDFYIVTNGLDEGERVVTQGAFKIDSALQIQAKPSMMNPDGGGAPPSHDHGTHASGASGETAMELSIPVSQALTIIGPYLKLHTDLANDDLVAAKSTLQDLMEVTGHSGPLPDLIHTMLAADSLDSMRKPHFETLSNALIKAVKSEPDAFSSDLYLMHCPMVYGSYGADWIQDSDALLNPYFGDMMLRCGELKEKLTANSNHSSHEH